MKNEIRSILLVKISFKNINNISNKILLQLVKYHFYLNSI